MKIDFDQLTILFIGLKLTHNISWPWWKVLMPSFVSIAINLIIRYHLEKDQDKRIKYEKSE